MIKYMKNFSILKKIDSIKSLYKNLSELTSQGRDFVTLSESQKLLFGKILINQIKSHGIYTNIQDTEFKVFSQFGDDGIIQYLVNNVKIHDDEKRFVEFGVEDYQESNTRFLLYNNNWQGLVMDGSAKNIDKITNDRNYWRYDLTALTRFVDKNNIGKILKENGFESKIGIFHIDIDGNDYWIWKELDKVQPIILIAEYNSVLGSKYPVTIPYSAEFYRTKAHYSNLYWGASIKAYYDLFSKRGYVFVGTNSAGNNAYFVRKDRLGKVKSISLNNGYTESRYRESRDEKGNLTYIKGGDRLNVIKNMILYNLQTLKTVKIKDLYNL